MPETAQNKNSYPQGYARLESRRHKTALGLIIPSLLGSFALFAGRARADGSQPVASTALIEHVGTTSSQLFVDNLDRAEAAAQKLEDMGMNAVRIPVPYTQGGAELNNDVNKLCVAAMAAEQHGLYPIFNPWGYKKNHQIGYMPHGSTPINKFTTTLNKYPWYLSGPDGCVKIIDGYQPLQSYGIGIFNEPNNPTFDPHPDPENYVRVVAAADRTLGRIATQLNVSIDVYAGDLSSSHDPIGYIRGMAPAIKQYGLYGKPFFDYFAYHPYEARSDISPLDGSAVKAVPKIAQALQETLGFNPKISLDEFGVQSEIPLSKRPFYRKLASVSIGPVSELVQGDYYQQFLSLAACYHVQDAMGFLLDKDDGDGWQSGLFYADGTPKSSAEIVKQAILEEKNGTLSTCP